MRSEVMPAVDLSRVSVSSEALALVPGTLARRLRCLPLTLEGSRLVVAVEDPANLDILDQVESLAGCPLEVRQASSRDSLELALQRYYVPETATDGKAPALFRAIFHRAVQIRASDIHLDPREDGGRVLLRVDGRLRDDRSLDTAVFTELVSVVKVMAGLDISERRLPQDGQFKQESAGEEFSLRVATLPMIHGEKVTLRLLSSRGDRELSSLEGLEMPAAAISSFREALSGTSGIVLLSGPTGSGKTTTLYAALRHLARDGDKHLLSIEDPVEVPIPGVNQVRVRQGEDQTGFHEALRSALRHDPDVIMIGEIRDAETADIAVKAAMTGHLVLSTVHANDAVGVVTRLRNLGVPPFLIASTLRLAMAQRLVRVPCSHCSEPVRVDPDFAERWGIDPATEVVEARGCGFCAGVGFAGRCGIYELVRVDDRVREAILRDGGEPEIRSLVFGSGGAATLVEDGLDKIRSGRSTPAEVERSVLVGA